VRPVDEDLPEIEPVDNAIYCMTILFFRAAKFENRLTLVGKESILHRKVEVIFI
jgi:hypothetical protein